LETPRDRPLDDGHLRLAGPHGATLTGLRYIRNTMILQTTLVTLALMFGGAQDIQDPEAAHPSHASWGEYALRGLDPIELCAGKDVAGDDRWFARWGRFPYRFASEANRARFLTDPERWCIQWDGACARMSPMGGAGSPQRWLLHDEHIYIFASDGCRSGFEAAPERYLPKSDKDTASTEAQLDAGQRWLHRAVEAHGGEAALRALPGVACSASREVDPSFSDSVVLTAVHGLTLMQNGDMRFASDRMVDGVPDIRTAWTLTQKDAFQVENDDVWPIHSAHGQQQVRRHAHRQPLTHLWAFLQQRVHAVHEGPGRLQDLETVLIRVTHDRLITVLHLDPKTGRILGMHWRGWVDDGVLQSIVESFTEWQDVAGVQIAKARTHSIDGKFFDPADKCYREVVALERAPANLVRPKASARESAKDD
tara:strand:+ start:349 stop:1617 length:1269 start_codon:yes stop_codon:yes gene_type:complete